MQHTQLEESVKQELKSMDQRLSDLEERMTSIDTKLTQVIDAILGNPLTKTGGFIHNIEAMEKRLDAMEKRQEKFEEFKKKLIWTMSIIIAIGAVIQYFAKLYNIANK